MWYSKALVRNFETKINKGITERGRCPLCDEEDNETYRTLKLKKRGENF
jgi:hypothetical protein